MKRRKTIKNMRGRGDLANIRLFQYLPEAIAESLSDEQKRAIAETILHLQTENPRILDEIYMERPYPGRPPGEWTIWDRVKRRITWRLKVFWLALLKQKSERRPRTRISDYIFLGFMSILLALVLGMVLWSFYWVKSDFLQLDLNPNAHVTDLIESK
jgi:hypothetical protein